MGDAAGYISLRQAIALLQGRSIPVRSSPLPEEANGQPEEGTEENQDET
jgi:hypothetical protein